MKTDWTSACRLGGLAAALLLAAGGCSLVPDRQVAYPSGVKRQAEVRADRRSASRPPVLRLGIEDQPDTLPSAVDD